MVLTGRLAPGEVLAEARLAERFGVSKTPVREALHILAAEGLVTVLPKKGYLVRTMSPQDLGEVLDLRMLLEPHAAAEAARHATSPTVSSLRGAVDRQRELTGGDPLAAMGAARDVHLALAAASRSTRLVAALERVLDDMARAHHVLPGLQVQMAHPGELAEHEAIVEAVAAGDGAAAERAMRAHLHSVRTTVLDHLGRSAALWSGPGSPDA
ncbi:GntR family transcriptional regulator [Citricoccus sp. SGAir0253]|nr:GntR family transcriptional regulator [Citricoccus sp. SGAir0253]